MKIIKFLTFLTILYAIITLISLETNPLEWGWFGRLAFIVLALPSISILTENDDDDDW